MTDNKSTFKYEFSGKGLSNKEKRWAKARFEEYLEIYPHLHKLGDLQLLEELVFLEALQERYKVKIGKLEANKTVDPNGKDDEKAVPEYLQRQLKTNLEQILVLKEKLGMFEDKKKLEAYEDLQSIFEKFAEWRKKNQGSRKVTCPFCSKIFFLMIRTDMYEEKKYPFFEDKVLCNAPLHKIWKEGRITTEEYAEIMGTSPDFPAWLEKKFFANPNNPETIKEDSKETE